MMEFILNSLFDQYLPYYDLTPAAKGAIRLLSLLALPSFIPHLGIFIAITWDKKNPKSLIGGIVTAFYSYLFGTVAYLFGFPYYPLIFILYVVVMLMTFRFRHKAVDEPIGKVLLACVVAAGSSNLLIVMLIYEGCVNNHNL